MIDAQASSRWRRWAAAAALLQGLAALAAAPADAAGPAQAAPTAAGVPALRLDAQLQFSIDEDRITTSVELRMSNASDRAVDLKAAPLLLPLPAPLVAGLPLDHGSIPPAAQSVEAEVTGDLKVERTQGGLAAVGVLAPGAEALVRVRYFLGYKSATLRLGFRGVGVQTYATAVVASAVPGRARLTTDRPARQLRLEQGEERLVGLAFAQGLGPGEVAILELADLPAPPAAPRLALTSAAVSLAGLALFWLMRQRGGSVHGA